MSWAGGLALGLAAGASLAAALALAALRRRPSEALVRVNVRGLPVPAILGLPVVAAGAATALASVAFGIPVAAALSVAGLCLALGAAGYLDDRAGDEGTRGFGGHLRAARSGRMTTGVVKLATGVLAGAAAGLVLETGWGIAATALLVALTANLVNLLDTAPGRAAKSSLAVSAALLVWGDAEWAGAAVGMIGAALACLPFDLRERAMLGDAGANPLGAVVGLGLALSLPPWAQWSAVAVVAALNLVSERWSFSAAIESSAPLRALDRLGRVREPGK